MRDDDQGRDGLSDGSAGTDGASCEARPLAIDQHRIHVTGWAIHQGVSMMLTPFPHTFGDRRYVRHERR